MLTGDNQATAERIADELGIADHVTFTGRDAGYRYLRAKGNSIEGGTSDILRNIVAERVLGLPREPKGTGR